MAATRKDGGREFDEEKGVKRGGEQASTQKLRPQNLAGVK
jgi:hypothetical protein